MPSAQSIQRDLKYRKHAEVGGEKKAQNCPFIVPSLKVGPNAVIYLKLMIKTFSKPNFSVAQANGISIIFISVIRTEKYIFWCREVFPMQ